MKLVASRRALQVRIAGEERYVAIEDAGRLRDALGTALPVGVPEVFTEPVADPLGDLVGRYARTHGPVPAAGGGARLGLGVAVVTATLHRLTGTGRLVTGEFRPGGAARSGATPTSFARSAGGAWRSCARRSSRSRPAPWPGSPRPGRASAAGSAAPTA